MPESRGSSIPSRAPTSDLIEREIHACEAELQQPDCAWPVDVRVLLSAVHARLFESDLKIGALEQQCGLCDHNTSSRFAEHVGMSPKKYLIHYRMKLAKRLLQDERLKQVTVTQIAFAVGYRSLGAFSKAFKRYEGRAPSTYQTTSKQSLTEKS